MTAVTVLMPAYRATRYVREAVQSLHSQTFSDWKLIVIGDGDGVDYESHLADLVTEKVVVVRNEVNSGISASLNRGLEMVDTPLVARMDADDVCDPKRLTCQVELFRDPRLAVVGSACRFIDKDGRAAGTYFPPSSRKAVAFSLAYKNPFLHPSVVFRADLVRRHGLRFSTTDEPVEDYVFFSEALRYGPGCNVPLPFLSYRQHENSISTVRRSEQLERYCAIALRNAGRIPALGPLGEDGRSALVAAAAGVGRLSSAQYGALASGLPRAIRACMTDEVVDQEGVLDLANEIVARALENSDRRRLSLALSLLRKASLLGSFVGYRARKAGARVLDRFGP